MTTYASEEHYLEDQIDSFAKAKKILKDYKKKIDTDLYKDFRGDKEKVLEGINKGVRFLEVERKKVKSELNDIQNQLKRLY